MLRVLCNAIVRKVLQRNQDNQKDVAPGIHFVKEKATATTISSAKTHNKKRFPTEILQLTVPIQENCFLERGKTTKYKK